MSFQKLPTLSSAADPALDGQVLSQFGALCYRLRRGKTQILLVTSRGTGRWIVPKGWPVPGATPSETAAAEAWEEAGVTGEVESRSLGIYHYAKHLDDGGCLPCAVALYPLRVKSLLRQYPERGERTRKWLSPKRAAALVSEPELSQIVLSFDPKPSKT